MITKLISENIYLASLAEIYLLKNVFSASAVRHSCPARPVSVQTDTLAAVTSRTVRPVKTGNTILTIVLVLF